MYSIYILYILYTLYILHILHILHVLYVLYIVLNCSVRMRSHGVRSIHLLRVYAMHRFGDGMEGIVGAPSPT